MRKNKIICFLFAFLMILGMNMTVFSSEITLAQSNKVFKSHVFISLDNKYVAADKNISLYSKEAKGLQLKFDRFFKNDLVGVYLTESTSKIAIKPIAGVNPSAILYDTTGNTSKTLQLLEIDVKGFWIFAVPSEATMPLTIVISNKKRVLGANLMQPSKGKLFLL